MGLLVNGKWVDKWYDTKTSKGKFKREQSKFRQWIKEDGSTPFLPESGRYHLYASLACSWAHRTLIFRKIKELENLIDISIVDPIMLENGWEFKDSEGSIPDSVNGAKYLYEIYLKADPDYTGRVTVPVLWDKKTNTIVNNESSEIIRMFNSEFNNITGNMLDFYPEELKDEIEKVNHFIYRNINNGVYKAGFATTQEAYNEAFENLFKALEKIEVDLKDREFLLGSTITEADWRLFTTLIRFDPVYVGHFKCNKKRIADYPALSRYLDRLINYPGVMQTINIDHIKTHYYVSHRTINPTGIIPSGPEMNL